MCGTDVRSCVDLDRAARADGQAGGVDRETGDVRDATEREQKLSARSGVPSSGVDRVDAVPLDVRRAPPPMKRRACARLCAKPRTISPSMNASGRGASHHRDACRARRKDGTARDHAAAEDHE
jgi:hypothetical protein